MILCGCLMKFHPILAKINALRGCLRAGFVEYPANAVRREVLNLPKQVEALPENSALAEAYRIIVQRSGPSL